MVSKCMSVCRQHKALATWPTTCGVHVNSSIKKVKACQTILQLMNGETKTSRLWK